MVSSAVQKLLSVIRFHLFNSGFISFVFGDRAKKKLCCDLCQSVLPLFPLGVLWYPVLHSDLQSILSLFLYIVLDNVLISSFTFSCPVLPAPIIEETVFSLWYILASFVID